MAGESLAHQALIGKAAKMTASAGVAGMA